MAKVDEGHVMAKHVDNGSADQLEVPLAREENEEEFPLAQMGVLAPS